MKTCDYNTAFAALAEALSAACESLANAIAELEALIIEKRCEEAIVKYDVVQVIEANSTSIRHHTVVRVFIPP